MTVFYFGAWGGPGHYIWTPAGGTMGRVGPWRDRDLDASSYTLHHGATLPTGRGFVPVDGEEQQGVWRITHTEGWTAIGCYDRTQDHRKGSISVFVAAGTQDEETMKVLAAKNFPAVWSRINGRAP